jgi:translation initiation factor IF-2
MAEVTVTQFAEVLKVSVDKLLSQLEEAGIRVARVAMTSSARTPSSSC